MTQLGPFILDHVLGTGGMATVWKAHHARQGTDVAIKVITTRLAQRQRYLRAFRSEVQAAARLHHPSIVTVYDEGVVPDDVDLEGLTPGSPFYAMELIEGEPLTLAGSKFGGWADTRDFLLRLLDALAHAHARGVVHRDLKPDNIQVSIGPDGRAIPHILDFGISHALGIHPDPDIDEFNNSVTGTPRYMAPEQIGGTWREQGPWTDLYSVGVLTFALVTGDVPFDGESAIATLRAHLEQPVPEVRPRFAVPEQIEAWIRRILVKKPALRFQRAADAAYALFRLGSIVEPTTVEPTLVDSVGPDPVEELPTLQFDRDQIGVPVARRGLGAEPSEWSEEMMRPLSPPMPMSWKRHHSVDQPPHLHGAGLGLFDMRSIPIVGRERERTLLWNQLSVVHETGALQAVHLQGAAGVGKSRIVEWIAERAEEVGSAQVLRVVHDRSRGPYDGFAGTIARKHRLAGLDRGEASARLLGDLKALDYPNDVRIYDSVALAEVALEQTGRDDRPRVRFSQPAERWVVYRRWLEQLTQQRPVFLWIDNLQWGTESIGFLEMLLGSPDLPVLVAFTTRDDARVLDPDVAARIEALDAHERVVATRVGPLGEEKHNAFVASLIGLEDKLAAALSARTAGNPLFAMQLVSDWVERGLLVAGERGFELVGDMPPIPEELHDVWVQRLGTICHSEQRWLALEVAAALGPTFELGLWSEAVGEDRTVADTFLDELVDAHLVERRNIDSGVASFTHTMLPESLERRARERGTWTRVNALCAEALQHAAESDPALLGRYGRHALESGDAGAAIAPLYRAAFWWMEGEELERARQFTRLLKRALDEMHGDGSTPDRLRAELLEGWIEERIGHHRQSTDRVRKVLIAAERLQGEARDEIMGRALRLRGKLERRQSLDRSTDSLRHAVEHLRRAGADAGELAKAQLARAWNLGRMGNLEEGIDGIAEALDMFDTHGDPRWLAIAHKSLGYLLAQKGDLDAAVAAVDEARVYAEEVGDRSEIANTHNSLGEFARFREDWATARAHYDEAESMERVTGGLNLPVYRFNRHLVDIGEEKWERASNGFEAMVQDWQLLHHAGIVANILMAQVACHAALRQWRAFDRDLAHAERELEMSGLIDRDVAWCAQIAAEQAESVGEATRAGILRQIESRQRDALN